MPSPTSPSSSLLPGAVRFPAGWPGSLAAHVSSGAGAGRVGLLGLPNDEGVALSGVRRGAERGPDGLRLALARFGETHLVERGSDLSSVRVDDLGDVPVHGLSAAAGHPVVEEAVEAAAGECDALVVMGGGHDLSAPAVRGAARAWGAPAGVNLDPHLDVRPVEGGRVSSGTPFWSLLDDGTLTGDRFLEIGASGIWNTASHLEWTRETGAGVRTIEEHRAQPFGEAAVEIAATLNRGDWAFADLDLDGFPRAAASAPGPQGWTVEEAADLAYLLGTLPGVRLFGLYEYAPRFDRDEVQARAALIALAHFLAGVASRTGQR